MEFIVCYGNPCDGFEYIGPFEDAHNAGDYAELWLKNFDWWIALLQKPCEEGEES